MNFVIVKTLHAYQSYVKDKGTTVGKKALKKKARKLQRQALSTLHMRLRTDFQLH